jgi:NitT/TauT family transport system substrate-binding protein
MKKSAQIATLATGIFTVTGLLAIGQAQTKPEVTMILDWFVEPPHGGFYAAVQDGLYEAKGVKVNLVPGGPTVAGYSLLGSGKVEFAMTDSAGMLSAREEGVPLVGVFASFQLSPQVLMYHKSNPIKSFKDLAGRQVAVTPGAPYWDFIMAKYNLKGKVQQVNYSGQQATFLNDQKLVSQGYAVAEPYTLEKAGADIGYLLVGDSGFSPYGMIATTEDYIAKNPTIVKAVVEATQEGWERYVANPTKYGGTLQAANKDLEPDFLNWSGKAVIPFVTGKNDDTKKHGLGYMSTSRWNTMYKALRQVGVLKKDQDPKKAFTMKFLPKP